MAGISVDLDGDEVCGVLAAFFSFKKSKANNKTNKKITTPKTISILRNKFFLASTARGVAEKSSFKEPADALLPPLVETRRLTVRTVWVGLFAAIVEIPLAARQCRYQLGFG